MVTRQTSLRYLSHCSRTLAGLLLLLLWQMQAQAARTAPPGSLWHSSLNRHLHQDSILQLLHTRRNELWVATLDGVTRFRGDHADHYQDLARHESGAGRPWVTGLVEAWEGRMIAATLGAGLLVYDEADDRFRSWPWGDGQRDADRHIAALHAEMPDQLWLGLEDGSLLRLGRDGHYQRLGPTLVSGRVSAISPLPRGGVVASTLHGDLRWVGGDGRLMRREQSKQACGLSRVEEVLALDAETVLVGSRGAGLWRLDARGACDPVPGFDQSPLAHSSVHSLHILHDTEEILVGTDVGLVLLAPGGVLRHYHRGNSNLQDNEVTGIADGPGEEVWVGTYDGLHQLARLPLEFRGQKDHSGLHTVAGITETPTGDLLIGAYHGLLVQRDGQLLTATEAGFPGGLHNHAVMGVYRYGDSLFIAYREAGLERIDLASGSVSRLSTKSRPALASDAVSAVLVTPSGNTLVGTYGGGLTLLHPDHEAQTFRAEEGSGTLADDRILMLFQSSDDRIWVGTESGLQEFDEKQGWFLGIPATDETGKAARPILWSATETTGGDLWFGSLHQGLWHLRAGKLRRATAAGSGRETIYALESDTSGRLWYTSNRGLNLRNPAGDHRQFGATFGLDNIEFELGSSHQDAAGYLYFGGNQGYFRFDPESMDLREQRPAVALTRYRLADNQPAPLRSDPDGGETIALSREDYWVSLEYSALSYRDPGSLRYRYRLRGLDPEWIDASGRRQATYTNLPAGTYHFDVQAAQGSHFDTSPVSTVTVSVPTPRWRTGWALALYATGAVCLWLSARALYGLYSAHRLTTRQMRETEATAGRIADDLENYHRQQTRLITRLQGEQERLLRWALNLPTEALSTGQAQALDALLSALDGQTLYQHEQRFLHLRPLIETLSCRMAESSAPLLVVNDCPDMRLPWQTAMALGVALWSILEALRQSAQGRESHCVVIGALSEVRSDGCQLHVHGEFMALPPALWRLAEQAVSRHGGDLSVSTGLIVLAAHWDRL